MEHEKFVQEEVLGLLRIGCVRETSNSVVYSPLGVVDNGKNTHTDC